MTVPNTRSIDRPECRARLIETTRGGAHVVTMARMKGLTMEGRHFRVFYSH